MKKINPMLLIDFYKAVHAEMLPEGITKSVSYFTPRMSRVKQWDHVVMFGLQGFIKTYLIDYFNKEFFSQPFDEVIAEYKRILDNTLGENVYKIDKIEKLHQLGYLPIEIVALPEGTRVPMHVPMFGITNTHPDFAWLPQSLESLISAESWHPMIAATVGYTYRQIVNEYYDMTCDDDVSRAKALGAFDFRGEECTESAIKAGAGWCLSFLNTATVPTIPYLEQNYSCDCAKEPVAFGSPSTEHSVMCSNYAVDGDEITLLRRLLTEIYPNTSFSVVLDSYDYWNVIHNVLPQLKDEIMAHNGCMLMRGDSGDCVEVVTETVFALWDMFGGMVNSKGYKVLDPHVKAIYGDSITVQRCEEIYQILKDNGFACSNVALGVGSFSFQCIEEDGELKPFTRDTFSSCIKATYCEISGKPTNIFKNPKDGGFKKSQRGCCLVSRDSKGDLVYHDELTWDETMNKENLLQPVFRNGELLKEDTLANIRDRLHNGNFDKTDYYLSEKNCYERLKQEFMKYGKLIFCVDFDDTLYDFHKHGWKYTNVIALLKRWERYSEVIIFTGNGEEKYPEIERYLNEKGIKYVGINCDSSIKVKGRKVYANVYLDDRGGLPFMYKMLNKLIKEIEEVQK